MRALRPITATLAALAATLGLPPAAHATTVNTFSGECQSAPGVARWPDSPLRSSPVDMRMIANVAGGTCSGTLNGERIEGVPLRVTIEIFGSHSCTWGMAQGRGIMTFAGRRIPVEVSYRRPALTPVLNFRGDSGGSAAAVVRAVVGPEATEKCNGEGIPEAAIVAERFTAQGISGPEPRSSRKPKGMQQSRTTYRQRRAKRRG